MEQHELVIIGSGISGLSLAQLAAQRGREVLVLEAAAQAGGCIRTLRGPGGFWLELGAHTCYNSYGGLLRLLEQTGGLARLLPRRKVPFRLLVGDQVRSIIRELSLPELLGSAWRIFTTRKAGLSVREYYSRLVGPGNYDRVFGPLFAAVPSQCADAFPAQLLFKSRPRRSDVARSFTLQGGLSSALEGLATAPQLQVRCNARAEQVSRQGALLRIRLHTGEELEAQHVALAVPPAAAAELLQAEFPQLARLLEPLRVTRVDSLGVIVKRDAVRLPLAAGFIPLDAPFHSVVTRDTVDDPTYRGFTFHFKAGRTLPEQRQIATAVLQIKEDQIEQAEKHTVLLPSPELGHHERIAQLDAALQETAALYVTGNYFGGLAIEDCVQRSQGELQRLGTRNEG